MTHVVQFVVVVSQPVQLSRHLSHKKLLNLGIEFPGHVLTHTPAKFSNFIEVPLILTVLQFVQPVGPVQALQFDAHRLQVLLLVSPYRLACISEQLVTHMELYKNFGEAQEVQVTLEFAQVRHEASHLAH